VVDGFHHPLEKIEYSTPVSFANSSKLPQVVESKYQIAGRVTEADRVSAVSRNNHLGRVSASGIPMPPDSIPGLRGVHGGSVALGDRVRTRIGISSCAPPCWTGVNVDSRSFGTGDVEVGTHVNIGTAVPRRTKRAPLESSDLLA